MNEPESILEVWRGDILLAVLTNIRPFDFPWYDCDFHATPDFEQYRPLFDEELTILERDGATDEWLLLEEKIENLHLTLRELQAEKTTDIFLMHVEDHHARFKAYFA